MPTSRRSIEEELGPTPSRIPEVSLWGLPLNAEAASRSQLEYDLYKQKAGILAAQQMNPLRDTTLGQMSRLTGEPMADIASPDQFGPTQYRDQPTGVPSYQNFIPTLTGEPQVQPPLAPHVSTGLARPAQSEYTYQESFRDPQENAPSNLYQQSLGESELKKRSYQTRWNPNAPIPGMGGVNTLNERYNMLMRGYVAEGMDPGEAHARASIGAARGQTGEQYGANLENVRARTNQADTNTMLAPQRLDETRGYHEGLLQDKRNRLNFLKSRTGKSDDLAERRVAVTEASLAERQKQWDQKMAWITAMDKPGMLSPADRDAAIKYLESDLNMQDRPVDDAEVTFWERIKQGALGKEPQRKEMLPRQRYAPQGKGAAATPPTTTPKGSVQIKSDEEYNKLAPGTKFVGPDGKERVKK